MIFGNMPELLKEHHNWVVWGIRDAPPKAPFNPGRVLSGRFTPARAGVRDTWGSYQDAAECVAQGLARGVGYEFDGNGLYGVDLDSVIAKSGALMPEAQEIVGKLDSYTEVSPSGTGLHIFVIAPGADIKRHRKKDFFLEIYGEGRYFTVTGIVYKGAGTIRTRTTELQSVHDNFLLPEAEHSVVSRPIIETARITGRDRFLQIGLERDKGFCAMWEGQRRHGNESADDIALMNKLAYWCNADQNAVICAFLSSPYYAQKDEPHKRKCQRSDYLPNTANNACATVYSTAAADYESWRRNRKPERYTAR